MQKKKRAPAQTAEQELTFGDKVFPLGAGRVACMPAHAEARCEKFSQGILLISHEECHVRGYLAPYGIDNLLLISIINPDYH